jgi:hypothetical protein
MYLGVLKKLVKECLEQKRKTHQEKQQKLWFLSNHEMMVRQDWRLAVARLLRRWLNYKGGRRRWCVSIYIHII